MDGWTLALVWMLNARILTFAELAGIAIPRVVPSSPSQNLMGWNREHRAIHQAIFRRGVDGQYRPLDLKFDLQPSNAFPQLAQGLAQPYSV